MKDKSGHNKKTSPIIEWLLVPLIPIVLGKEVFRNYRKQKQNDLQKDVDSSYSEPNNESDIITNHISFEMVESSTELTDALEEIQILHKEDECLKSFVANSLGEVFKSGVISRNFDGLLKSDIPIYDLCRVAGHPHYLRGFSKIDNKIADHAKLKEVSGSVLTPVVIFQVLTIVTSQYHMQQITELLVDIHNEIDKIRDMLEYDDFGVLKASQDALFELMPKNNYDNSDKNRALSTRDMINKIRRKYIDLLSNIKDLKIDYRWGGYKESQYKVKKLQSSNYLLYLNVAIQAEILWIMASLVLVKISKQWGNKEDEDLYQQGIDFGFWGGYRDKFYRIRYDVLKYLELEKERSIFNKNKIERIKDAQERRFNEITDYIQKYQKQLGGMPIYIKYSDGDIRLYVSKYKN